MNEKHRSIADLSFKERLANSMEQTKWLAEVMPQKPPRRDLNPAGVLKKKKQNRYHIPICDKVIIAENKHL